MRLNSNIQLANLCLVLIAVSCVESNSQLDPLAEVPNLVGAKLVGIFEDDKELVNAAHKYSKQAQRTKSKPNKHYRPGKVNLDKLHYCDENIFEDGTMHTVPSSEPRCVLGHTYSDQEAVRRRRDVKASLNHFPNHFLIPTGEPKEKVDDVSYIKLQLRVCSQPGGEVLVFDKGTKKILNQFKNGGTAYQCNKWTDEFEASISDTSQVQVEYNLPVGDDFELSKVTYDYLKNNKDEGHRSIQYSKGNDVIFQLDLKYTEVEFIYEEPPEELTPIGDSEMQVDPVHYKPNWVKTYILKKRSRCDVGEEKNCQDKFFVGISVEILQLNLDFDKGDYLLVGPGEQPEFWKNSKGQMIAQEIKETDSPKHKIWINADSAFIRVVTHNSLIESNNNQTALQFKWRGANDTLGDVSLGDVSQLLKEASIQLCFAGYDCTYYTTVESLFIEEAVHIFNHYLIDHEKSVTTLINKDSVQIFDIEPIFYNKGHFTESYCQFHLAISSPYDSEYPLVQSDVLRAMFFGNSNSRKMIGQKVVVNNCVFQRISWATILIPIAVIILLSTGIILVFWRIQTKMMQKGKNFNTKNKESLERLQPVTRQYDDAMQY